MLLLAAAGASQACPLENEAIQVTANGHTLTAEVAASRASHMCGLALRRQLSANHGMLFAYAQEQIIGFWMKNTYIPLSIAFLDSSGRILETHDMDPGDPGRRYISKTAARYALEVNQGWFSKNSIKVGDTVEFNLQAGQQVFRFEEQ